MGKNTKLAQLLLHKRGRKATELADQAVHRADADDVQGDGGAADHGGEQDHIG